MADITSSTYYNTVMSLKGIIEAHPAVKTCRIGPISSVEIPDTDVPIITYPYVHIISQPSRVDKSNSVFDFDMLIMDLVDMNNPDLQLRQQSQMLEIARDIIAKYVMTDWGTWRFNLGMPLTATPFVERFVNAVAGWTIQLSITALTPLNNCNNPVDS